MSTNCVQQKFYNLKKTSARRRGGIQYFFNMDFNKLQDRLKTSRMSNIVSEYRLKAWIMRKIEKTTIESQKKTDQNALGLPKTKKS